MSDLHSIILYDREQLRYMFGQDIAANATNPATAQKITDVSIIGVLMSFAYNLREGLAPQAASPIASQCQRLLRS